MCIIVYICTVKNIYKYKVNLIFYNFNKKFYKIKIY